MKLFISRCEYESYVKIQHAAQHLWGLNILTYEESTLMGLEQCGVITKQVLEDKNWSVHHSYRQPYLMYSALLPKELQDLQWSSLTNGHVFSVIFSSIACVVG